MTKRLRARSVCSNGEHPVGEDSSLREHAQKLPCPVAQYPLGEQHPKSAAELVSALHTGRILAFPPTLASLDLVDSAGALLRSSLALDGGSPWSDVRAVPDPYFRLHAARTALAQNDNFKARIAEVCRSLGFSEETKVDAPRLRSITAGAERCAAAAPVYVLHRDTWYGCPQSLIIAWMPLHDVRAEDVFAFYPDCFARPVPNGSKEHDQRKWMREVGWHGKTAPENFVVGQPVSELGPEVRWGLKKGSILLFSAAQLHRTLPNPSEGDTRYSLDFRILPQGVTTAAPNVDNESSGSTVRVEAEFWPIRNVPSSVVDIGHQADGEPIMESFADHVGPA